MLFISIMLIPVVISGQTRCKVDINIASRQEEEVNEPDYTSWPIVLAGTGTWPAFWDLVVFLLTICLT
ncbi:MAG: hypothetical protein ISS19_09800 [Bacteroidales bacterium]|nr:hypothetical protein [Bacteroidales bacterium]